MEDANVFIEIMQIIQNQFKSQQVEFQNQLLELQNQEIKFQNQLQNQEIIISKMQKQISLLSNECLGPKIMKTAVQIIESKLPPKKLKEFHEPNFKHYENKNEFKTNFENCGRILNQSSLDFATNCDILINKGKTKPDTIKETLKLIENCDFLDIKFDFAKSIVQNHEYIVNNLFILLLSYVNSGRVPRYDDLAKKEAPT